MKLRMLVAASSLALSPALAAAATWVQYDIYGAGDYYTSDQSADPTVYTHDHAALHGTFFIDLDAADHGVPPIPIDPPIDWYSAAASHSALTFHYQLVEDCRYGCVEWGVNLQFAPGSFSTFPAHVPALVRGDFYWTAGSHWSSEDATGAITVVKSKLVDAPGPWRFDVRAVPEPASWAMMLIGFGAIGGALRRGRKPAITFA